jgi:putative restriction endonuclease
MPKHLWTREEMILAFNLYLKLPFGKMHKHNPEIIELAKLLGRTPSSIGMRLVNFASCDPQLQARGVGGLKGGLNQVKPIWDEFYDNQEELVFLSEQILADKQHTSIEKKYASILADLEVKKGVDTLRLVKTRVNQSVFRTMVLNNYDSVCCITGINIPELLIASHILPWSENEKERLNPRNGLCLNGLHDKAYDNGLVSITPDYEVRISSALLSASATNETLKNYFQAYDKKKILVPKKFVPSQEFLDYHFKIKFQG